MAVFPSVRSEIFNTNGCEACLTLTCGGKDVKHFQLYRSYRKNDITWYQNKEDWYSRPKYVCLECEYETRQEERSFRKYVDHDDPYYTKVQIRRDIKKGSTDGRTEAAGQVIKETKELHNEYKRMRKEAPATVAYMSASPSEIPYSGMAKEWAIYEEGGDKIGVAERDGRSAVLQASSRASQSRPSDGNSTEVECSSLLPITAPTGKKFKLVTPGMDTHLAAKYLSKLVIQRANSLWKGLRKIMENFVETEGMFAGAGQLMNKQAQKMIEYQAAKKEYDEASPEKEEELYDKLTAKEEELADTELYTGFEEYTDPKERQLALKAVDYYDTICEGWRIYNVCRAKTGEWDHASGRQCDCGLAYPSKLWRQKGASMFDSFNLSAKWQWTCNLQWQYLIDMAKEGPGLAYETVKELEKDYGEDKAQWPQIGCGCDFYPWKKGYSMVCEIEMDVNGQRRWEAFLSDRLPTSLDIVMKQMNKDAISKAFGQVSPSELYRQMPMMFPMTHIHEEGGRSIPCVAKYPINLWEKQAAERVTFDIHTWALICIAIAEKDMDALGPLYEKSREILSIPRQAAEQKFR